MPKNSQTSFSHGGSDQTNSNAPLNQIRKFLKAFKYSDRTIDVMLCNVETFKAVKSTMLSVLKKNKENNDVDQHLLTNMQAINTFFRKELKLNKKSTDTNLDRVILSPDIYLELDGMLMQACSYSTRLAKEADFDSATDDGWRRNNSIAIIVDISNKEYLQIMAEYKVNNGIYYEFNNDQKSITYILTTDCAEIFSLELLKLDKIKKIFKAYYPYLLDTNESIAEIDALVASDDQEAAGKMITTLCNILHSSFGGDDVVDFYWECIQAEEQYAADRVGEPSYSNSQSSDSDALPSAITKKTKRKKSEGKAKDKVNEEKVIEGKRSINLSGLTAFARTQSKLYQGILALNKKGVKPKELVSYNDSVVNLEVSAKDYNYFSSLKIQLAESLRLALLTAANQYYMQRGQKKFNQRFGKYFKFEKEGDNKNNINRVVFIDEAKKNNFSALWNVFLGLYTTCKSHTWRSSSVSTRLLLDKFNTYCYPVLRACAGELKKTDFTDKKLEPKDFKKSKGESGKKYIYNFNRLLADATTGYKDEDRFVNIFNSLTNCAKKNIGELEGKYNEINKKYFGVTQPPVPQSERRTRSATHPQPPVKTSRQRSAVSASVSTSKRGIFRESKNEERTMRAMESEARASIPR